MKKYKVVVNGVAYEVDVELLSESEASAPVQVAAPVQAPVAPVAPAAPVAGGENVNAPMPGTILDVKVANGQAVKKGDVLVILEAMKMENEILAPCDGTVSYVIAKGSSVETGTLLSTI
ncbi:MAG: biotin/lipoyl-binding protein [Clostridia bacterium]|nr:biotin/lipoyl-binding protein [Clostridia bacterium]